MLNTMKGITMRKFYVSAWKGGVIQARKLIEADDESSAEAVFLRQNPGYRGMAIVCEGTFK